MLNPRPFEKFFDIIVVGEGDEVLPRILDVMMAGKGQRRAGIVEELGPSRACMRPFIPSPG